VAWMRVRFELARSKDFPEGSHRHGYEFVLPLDKDGRIDLGTYRRTPELCTVHRFWAGGNDVVGTIKHMGHGRWLFSFHRDEMENESIPHFAEHPFRESDYRSVRERDGTEHTFRIVLVEPAPGLAPG